MLLFREKHTAGKIRRILARCRKRKRPIPEFLQNVPKLKRQLLFYMEAFNELSTTRSVGFGVGPIPWTALDRYAVRYGVKDFDRFVFLIRHMDDSFCKAKKPPKEGSNGNAEAGS